MNDAPRRTLRELISRHGPGLCSDARRCEGLLRDLSGEHRREINILVGALRERVPLDLLAARNSVPTGLLLTRLSKRLEDQLALTEEASSWAVDSWALALGVVSDAELEAIKGRRDEADAPRVEAGPTPAATRPAAEDDRQPGKPAARTGTRPTATPPLPKQSPTPPAARTPTASTSPVKRLPAAPTSRTHARVGPAAPAPQQTPARTPSSPQSASTRGLQEPADDPAPRGRRGRWRGCLVGCFLVALLSALLALGVPFVVNILREEQQQRGLESPPVQTR